MVSVFFSLLRFFWHMSIRFWFFMVLFHRQFSVVRKPWTFLWYLRLTSCVNTVITCWIFLLLLCSIVSYCGCVVGNYCGNQKCLLFLFDMSHDNSENSFWYNYFMIYFARSLRRQATWMVILKKWNTCNLSLHVLISIQFSFMIVYIL